MKTAVLLINLGTPTAPTTGAVRRYLRQFLSDPRVIDINPIARKIILNLFILPFRPKQSAKAYASIWSEQGSPLLLYSQQLATQVQQVLGADYIVELGMRYGEPSIETAAAKLLAQNPDKIVILPLFPQYSSAASGSAIEEALKCLNKQHNFPQITVINDFYQNSLFIESQAQLWQQPLQQFNPDLILFSYHGLPERHVLKSDNGKIKNCDLKNPCPVISTDNRFCYRAQCYATSKALATALQLKDEQYQISFQSRLGRTPWIKPYTDEVLPQLRQQGVKNLAIACPSFVADCLETLEEIGIRAREQWHALGGEELKLLPCVNAEPAWAKAVATMVATAYIPN